MLLGTEQGLLFSVGLNLLDRVPIEGYIDPRVPCKLTVHGFSSMKKASKLYRFSTGEYGRIEHSAI